MTTPGQGPEYQVPIPWDAVEWDGQGPNVGSLNAVLQNLQAQITGLTTSIGGIPVTTGKTDYALTVGASPGYAVGWNYYLGWFVVVTTLTSAAIQAAVTAAAANGYSMVLLRPGQTYAVTSTVVVSTAGATPGHALQIRCYGQAIFDMHTMANGSIGIQWIGTQGQAGLNNVIEGIRFKGAGVNSAQIALEYVSVDGALCNRCRFESLGTGVMFANIGGGAAGPYTEGCIVQDCSFEQSVNIWVEYYNNGGAQSFHGSGMRGGNWGNIGNGCYAVKVGAGCDPYNSPLELTAFFTAGGGATLINNQSILNPNFKGWIRLEGDRTNNLSLCDPNGAIFSGPVSSSGPTWTKGALTFVEDWVINADGSISARGSRISLQIDNFNSGFAILGMTGTWRCTVAIQNAAGTYDYRYSFTAQSDDYGGAGYVNAEASDPMLNVDAVGYGAPLFTVSNAGVLVATQAGYPTSGLTMYCDAVQLSQSLNYNRLVSKARINDLYAVSFLAADVALNPTNVITLTGGNVFSTDMRIRYSVATGGTITGLTSGNYYYVMSATATTLQLSLTASWSGTGAVAILLTAVTPGAKFQLFTY